MGVRSLNSWSLMAVMAGKGWKWAGMLTAPDPKILKRKIGELFLSSPRPGTLNRAPGRCSFPPQKKTMTDRWWQGSNSFWNFHPENSWGNGLPIWLAHISQMGGKQPPTRWDWFTLWVKKRNILQFYKDMCRKSKLPILGTVIPPEKKGILLYNWYITSPTIGLMSLSPIIWK